MKITTEPNKISFFIKEPIYLIVEPWADEYMLEEIGEYIIDFESNAPGEPESEQIEDIFLVFAPSESIYTLHSPKGVSIGGNDIQFPATPSGMSIKDFMNLVGLRNEGGSS